MARSIRLRRQAGDIVHVATATAFPAASARTMAPKLGATVIPMSGGQTEKQVQLIMDFQPDIIMVTPSYIPQHRRRVQAAGHRPARGTRLRLGIFGAEPWTDQMRKEIERPSASTRSTSTGSRK